MADCLTKIPLRLKEPIESGDRWITEISVPCGKCARCIERRKLEWGFRMDYEMMNSKTAYFVTLTYDTKTVPYEYVKWDKETKKRSKVVKTGGNKTLNPMDLELFFKRLRQNHIRSNITLEHLFNNLKKNDKIKYYAAGEYGENFTRRPHFHAIIFNASRSNIEKSWELGNVHCVKANKYTVAYVMKYLDKSIGTKQTWKVHPEYNTMSEGIGAGYIAKNKNWHRQNLDCLFVTNYYGIKFPMPKYYREQIFNEAERRLQVGIVEKVLFDQKESDIIRWGADLYCKKQIMKEVESTKRFKKKMKKRIID